MLAERSRPLDGERCSRDADELLRRGRREPADLDADRGRRRPGQLHRRCGSGSPRHAGSASRSACRCAGVVDARRAARPATARERGLRRRPPRRGLRRRLRTSSRGALTPRGAGGAAGRRAPWWSATARCATATARGRRRRCPADDSPLHVPRARHHAALRARRPAEPSSRCTCARPTPTVSCREGRLMMTAVDVRRCGRPTWTRSSGSSARLPDAVVALDVRRRAREAERRSASARSRAATCSAT